jgi:hypothetical protein
VIVYLMPELFTDRENVSPLALFSLWRHGAQGRHILSVEHSRDAFERWLGDWPVEHALRVEIERAEAQGADALGRSPLPELRIEICAGGRERDSWEPQPRLCLETALRLMERPLQLLVENQRSDGAFLLALHRALASWDEALYELFEELREVYGVVFLHGGGNLEIANALRVIKAQKDEVGLRRTWTMIDHDGKRADIPHENSDEAMRVAHGCGVPHHRLKRRAIENYIPLAALELLVARLAKGSRQQARQALDAYKSELMTDEARWFYHLKDGMRKSDEALIPEPLREALRAGFKSLDLAAVFEDEAFDVGWLVADDMVRDEAVEIFGAILARR